MSIRICFVCTGNICRSPTAEVVLTRLVDDAGLSGRVRVSSAGTANWHAGKDMDPRSRRALEAAGYAPESHSARQFGVVDFDAHDLIVALDSRHHGILQSWAAQTVDPDQTRGKIVLLRSYDSTSHPADRDVPDPYYDAEDGFALVLDQIERACAGLLAELAVSDGSAVRG